MSKMNCWEFKKCGREIDGDDVAKCGVCPAANNIEADGFCGGKYAGRACIYVIGTLCGGGCQQTYESKEKMCNECDFHLQLKKEHPVDMTIFSYFDYVIKHDKENPKKNK